MKNQILQGLLFLVFLTVSISCEDFGDDLEGGFEDELLDERAFSVIATYQAENRTGSSGCQVATEHVGFTGSGFIDYGGKGSWIEWNQVQAPVDGQYKLSFRYAVGTSTRPSAVFVDGKNVGNLGFGNTSSWTKWNTSSITVKLRQGRNTIRVTAVSGNGGPNLDKMDVSVNDQCPDDPDKITPGECGCGVREESCDNIDDLLFKETFDSIGGSFKCTRRTCTWTSKAIDVAGSSRLLISADTRCYTLGKFESADYIKMSYSIDGGSWVMFLDHEDDLKTRNVSELVNNSGGSLRIKIDARTSWKDETYEVDNLTVKGNGGDRPSEKYDSYKGLVMFGYQGWFNAPNDGAEQGWRHYKKDGKFEPGSCTIDFWPDMREYQVKHKTSFKFRDGSSAYVFSSYDSSTVDLHFKWMADYDIDGAFMQRFTHSITETKMNRHYMKVFDSAIKAARKYDRAISIRYDITSCDSGDWRDLLDDLDTLDDKYDFHGRDEYPTFLHHNGKPLIAIGGVGWEKDIADGSGVKGYLDEAEHIVEGLIDRGYSILVRVPHSWQRGRSSQMLQNENDIRRFEKLIKKCDIVMPWHVGAYRQETYEKNKWYETIANDMKWCEENNLDYVPVLFPGFSWYNMKGSLDSFRPRNGGAFFWMQAYWAVQKGAEMLFLAQFDELDEGTQFFKSVHDGPVGASPFVGYEQHVESDHYLWLAGKSREMLLGEIPTSKDMPLRE